jgi:hypothetical protein
MNREARKDASNLDAMLFQDANVWLPDLMLACLRAGQPIIRGRTFNNCLLYGPAVLLGLSGIDLDSCNLGYSGGDIRNLALRPVSPNSVIGALPFQDCRFFECDFDMVGFTGAEPFVQLILGVSGVHSS